MVALSGQGSRTEARRGGVAFRVRDPCNVLIVTLQGAHPRQQLAVGVHEKANHP